MKDELYRPSDFLSQVKGADKTQQEQQSLSSLPQYTVNSSAQFFSQLNWRVDKNNDYELEIRITNNNLDILFLHKKEADSAFFENLFGILKITINGELIILAAEKTSTNYHHQQIISEWKFPLEINFYLKGVADKLLYTAFFEDLHCKPQEKIEYQLSVSQTRHIRAGRYHQEPLRYFNSDSAFLKTDLHTHFDAILPAADLLELAKNKQLKIDIEKLKKRLDIEFKIKKNTVDAEGKIEINILEKEYLEIFQKFSKSLAIPSGKITGFVELEKIYDLRDLITGAIELFEDLLWRIAEYYIFYKIKYVEISMHDIAEKDWLEKALTVLQKIEEQGKIQIRFLAALYNYQSEKEIISDISRIQRISSCPYIVGVDFAGHEQYSFFEKKIIRHIENIAAWCSKFNPDFIIRIHAGENSLHIDNVKVILSIALKYNVRMRIGHGVYGLDKDAIEFLQILRKKVMLEFNPDSNIALSNITSFQQIPLLEFSRKKIGYFIGTDGPGIYKTTPEQLVVAVQQIDASTENFNYINAQEDEYIAFQNKCFIKKLADWKSISENIEVATNTTNCASISVYNPSLEKKPSMMVNNFFAKSEKKPIYIASNGRTPSAFLETTYLEKVSQWLRKFISIVDPEKSYFVINVTRTEINSALIALIESYNKNQTNPSKKFLLLYLSPEESKQQVAHLRPMIASRTLTDFPKIIEEINKPDANGKSGLVIITDGDPITVDTLIYSVNSRISSVLLSDSRGLTKNFRGMTKNSFGMEDGNQWINFLSNNFSHLLRKQPVYGLVDEKFFQPEIFLMKMFIGYIDFDQYPKKIEDWYYQYELSKTANLALIHSRAFILKHIKFLENPSLILASMSEEFCLVIIKLFQVLAKWLYVHSANSTAEVFGQLALKLCNDLQADDGKAKLLLAIDSDFSLGCILSQYSYIPDSATIPVEDIIKKSFGYLNRAYEKTSFLYGEKSNKVALVLAEIAKCYMQNYQLDIAKNIFNYLCNAPDLMVDEWQKLEYAGNYIECSFIQAIEVPSEVEKYFLDFDKVYQANDHPLQSNKFGKLYLLAYELALAFSDPLKPLLSRKYVISFDDITYDPGINILFENNVFENYYREYKSLLRVYNEFLKADELILSKYEFLPFLKKELYRIVYDFAILLKEIAKIGHFTFNKIIRANFCGELSEAFDEEVPWEKKNFINKFYWEFSDKTEKFYWQTQQFNISCYLIYKFNLLFLAGDSLAQLCDRYSDPLIYKEYSEPKYAGLETIKSWAKDLSYFTDWEFFKRYETIWESLFSIYLKIYSLTETVLRENNLLSFWRKKIEVQVRSISASLKFLAEIIYLNQNKIVQLLLIKKLTDFNEILESHDAKSFYAEDSGKIYEHIIEKRSAALLAGLKNISIDKYLIQSDMLFELIDLIFSMEMALDNISNEVNKRILAELITKLKNDIYKHYENKGSIEKSILEMLRTDLKSLEFFVNSPELTTFLDQILDVYFSDLLLHSNNINVEDNNISAENEVFADVFDLPNQIFLNPNSEQNEISSKPRVSSKKIEKLPSIALVKALSKEWKKRSRNNAESLCSNLENQQLIQSLLQQAHIVFELKFVKIEFSFIEYAKDFVAELLKVGFGNRMMPNYPKKIEPRLTDPNSNNNAQDRYIVELTWSEWNALQENNQPSFSNLQTLS